MRYRVLQDLGPSLRKGSVKEWSITPARRIAQHFDLELWEVFCPEDCGEAFVEKEARLSPEEKQARDERIQRFNAWAEGYQIAEIEAYNDDDERARVEEAVAKLEHARQGLESHRVELFNLRRLLILTEIGDDEQAKIREAEAGVSRWINKVEKAQGALIEAERDLQRKEITKPVRQLDADQIRDLRVAAVQLVVFEVEDYLSDEGLYLVFTHGPQSDQLVRDFKRLAQAYGATTGREGSEIFKQPDLLRLIQWAKETARGFNETMVAPVEAV